VYDTTGGVVPAAKMTLNGPIGTKTQDSDNQGEYMFPLLIPGIYSLKAEKAGFKTSEIKGIEVFTGRTTTIRITLEAGAVTQVIEVTSGAIGVDTASTAIGANLPDTFYQSVPVTRNLAGLFYLSVGVADGGGSGFANPSISGGSGLENLYLADGVNITDSSYGGLGVFSRIYGSLGTGINLTFVKEVQVKTGGYEPQYGRATGGIVQIVTKSGSNDYHGALAGYFAPRQFEATRLQPDDFGRKNLLGKLVSQSNWDGSAEFGGYVPGFRDHFFFFGSINPSYAHNFVLAPPNSGLFSHGEFTLRTNTLNYAAKGTYRVNEKNQFEASIFGDPANTNLGPRRTLVTDNSTSFSKFEYGTKNLVARYNGTFSPTWLVNGSFTWGTNKFAESGFANTYQIVDRTQASGLPGQRGVFTPIGLGFNEPSDAWTYAYNLDTSKEFRFVGKHTFSIGYRYERPYYNDGRERSGPRFPIPATNAAGDSVTTLGVPTSAIGLLTNASFSLRLAASSCTLCPLMNVPGRGQVPVFLRQDRGEFGPSPVKTRGLYHAAYVNDSWSPNKFITVNLGLRWELQKMIGTAINYSYTDNWSPRAGIIVDPWGNRKTKIFANFGRYNYVIPLDTAIRSLSNELDFTSARWAPAFTVNSSGQRIATINSFGTVNPLLDAAHLLNRAHTSSSDIVAGACINPLGCGTGTGIGISLQSTEGIAAGTKMEYVDEFVVGFEREFKGGIIFSARYLDRRMKRIVEDMSGIPPEAFNANLNQDYLIGNVNASTDLFTNPIAHVYASGGAVPAACNPDFVQDPVEDTFGNILGAVCYEPTGVNGQLPGTGIADGVPDGFPNPVRIYQAVEIEFTKAFSKNWQMRANWRIAKLFGNFEGAFRNDNGQTDPSISSLFDFVAGNFNLLGDQFKPGVLNTDRRHIVNAYLSYAMDSGRLKGMTLGLGIRVQSGIPINQFVAHPAYLNSGEVPLNGRGSLGRLPVTGSVDAHVDYPWRISERWRLRFGMDMFNIANSRRATLIDQNLDSSFGTRNTDFLKPLSQGDNRGFQRPFNARASVRLEF